MKLAILIGSARKKRRSQALAEFVYQNAKDHKSFSEVELLDLAKQNLSVDLPSGFNGNPDYDNPATKKWSDKIAPADAFIFVMPEHNHGYSAVLKLAIDYLYQEWNHKPVVFVTQGGIEGARAIENILSVVKAVQLVPVNADVRFSQSADLDEDGHVIDQQKATKRLNSQLDKLAVYAKGLKSIRQELSA